MPETNKSNPLNVPSNRSSRDRSNSSTLNSLRNSANSSLNPSPSSTPVPSSILPNPQPVQEIIVVDEQKIYSEEEMRELFDKYISDRDCKKLFMKYLKSRYNDEMLNFLEHLKNFNKIPTALKDEKFNKAQQIIQMFIVTGAEQELNLNGAIKRDTLEQLDKLKQQRVEVIKKDFGDQRQILIQQVEALEKLFNQLKKSVLFQLRDENFSDFLRSDFFKQQFQQASTPAPVPIESQKEDDKKKKKKPFSLLFVFKRSKLDDEEEQPSTSANPSPKPTPSHPLSEGGTKPEFQKIQLKKAAPDPNFTQNPSNKHPTSDNDVLVKIEQMQEASGTRRHKKSVVNNRIQAFTALSENNQSSSSSPSTNSPSSSTPISRRRTESSIEKSTKTTSGKKPSAEELVDNSKETRTQRRSLFSKIAALFKSSKKSDVTDTSK